MIGLCINSFICNVESKKATAQHIYTHTNITTPLKHKLNKESFTARILDTVSIIYTDL